MTGGRIMIAGLVFAVMTQASLGRAQPAGGGAEGDPAMAGAPLYISPSGVRVIQQSLNQGGYADLVADGRWTEETREALRDFQQARGLEPTGNLDLATINALGLSFGGTIAPSTNRPAPPEE